MKKQQFYYAMLSLILIAIISCDDPKAVQADIHALQTERTMLQHEVYQLALQRDAKIAENTELDNQNLALKIYASGKQPKYILRLKLKQSHFMDLDASIKDAMNTIFFEIPVSKEFYNSVQEGQEIVDRFRVGSFILNGSLGDWEMIVKDKEIRQ